MLRTMTRPYLSDAGRKGFKAGGGKSRSAVDNGIEMLSAGAIRAVMRKPPYVRGFPVELKNIKRGTQGYKEAMVRLRRRRPQDDARWVTEFKQFAQLRNCEFEVDSTRMKLIEQYIAEISKTYSDINSKSNEVLSQKLAQNLEQWVDKYRTELPDISEILSNKKKAEANNETGEVKKLKKDYDNVVRDIKNSHTPTVYAAPGNTNFEYLCNSIRLVSSKQTICFALDVEAYEFDTNVVTEIGISIYDPRENVHSMIPLTRNFHILITESLELRNKKWVCDYKDCYLLGESLVLSLEQTANFVQALVNYYMVPTCEQEMTWNRAFVGHNVSGDLHWLQTMGVVLPEDSKIDHALTKLDRGKVLVLDTEKLYKFCYGSKGSSLGKILRLFQLPHAFLHNAGNDAYYTLQLLIHFTDVNFRKQFKMDDLMEMSHKINKLREREMDEDKILPMSYAVSVLQAATSTEGKVQKPAVNNKKQQQAKKKKNKELVHQTEFGGSRWFATAIQAFANVIE